MPELVTVLIVVDSWQGHTYKVGERVADGVRSMAGTLAALKTVETVLADDLRQSDALVLGSPVHQRSMSWKMKKFIDEICEPAWFFDDMTGKVGAVFTTGGGHGNAGGGCEMTQLGLLANLAALGMVLVSHPKNTPGFDNAGMHWGPDIKTTDATMVPLPVDALDPLALQAFFHHGANIATVTQRLKGVRLAAADSGWPTPALREGRAKAEGRTENRLAV